MVTNLKKYFHLFLIITIASCNNGVDNKKTNQTQDYSYLDRLIKKNSVTNDSMSNAVKNSDSSITKKIEVTVKQIDKLEKEVKVLKKENNELKNIIDKSDDVGKPFKLMPISDSKDNR